MSKGFEIIVEGTRNKRGHSEWGVIQGTPLPGAVMALYSTGGMQGGRFYWWLSDPGTAGQMVPHAILVEDSLQGFLPGVAYVQGTMAEIYFPLRGENMNVQSTEGSGTGQTFAIGEDMIINSSGGNIIPKTGSPQEYFAQSLEAVHQAGNYLLWVMMY